jgi:hypothetical protein
VAPPPLAIISSNNEVTIVWPDPSTGFVLESTTNLLTTAWSQVTNLVQTNGSISSVTIPTQSSTMMFMRLALMNDSLPTTETVAVTVTDANGVSVQTNQTFPVQAEPIHIVAGGINYTYYGTESPYAPSQWFQYDQAGWQLVMGSPLYGGGWGQFCWTGYSSVPGDFIEPSPPGTDQTIPPDIFSTPPFNVPGPVIYADADSRGVNTANFVMYLGHGNVNCLSFTYPNYPLDGTPAFRFQLAGSANGNTYVTYTDSNNVYNLVLTRSWGNMGPNERLNWLCFESCLVMQYNFGLPDDTSPPNHSGWYA